MTKISGPIVSSSIAERKPPWTMPIGLRNSGLPSKPSSISPAAVSREISRQPSNFALGGAVSLSNIVPVMIAIPVRSPHNTHA